MTNIELKEIIAESVSDMDELSEIIVLEGDEFADGAIGLTLDDRVVYSYYKLVEALSHRAGWTEEEASEWLEYNTIRSLPYMESEGKAPIIIMEFN